MNFDSNITHILEQQAQRNPDAIAIIDMWQGKERRMTFRQLSAASSYLAEKLLQRGMCFGDGALVLVPMSAELYITIIAMFRIGAVTQFIDPSAGLQHIAQCCAIGKPKAFIGSPKAHLLRFASSALRRIPLRFATSGSFFGTGSLHINDSVFKETIIQPCEPDAPALLTFTSGSTGQPKAIVRTHGFLQIQHQILSSNLSLQAGEIEFCTLPIFVLANLASGITSVLPDADLRRPANYDGDRIWNQLGATQPQRAAAPPAFWERLCEYSQGNTLPFLNCIHTGGGPVTPKLLRHLQLLAPKARITAVYGSTEAEPIAHFNYSEMSLDDQEKTQSGCGLLAGRVVPETQLRIMPDNDGKPVGPLSGDDFENKVLPVGQVGEIVVTGQHVVRGYINGVGDEETKFAVEQDIWHRTGDAGYLDEQNRLWLMGRCSARIVDKYGELYPFAVECAAQELSSVKRAALVQHEGRRVLVVICDDAVDAPHIKQKLSWARLHSIARVEEIPTDKRHNSKVDYIALRHLMSKKQFREIN